MDKKSWTDKKHEPTPYGFCPNCSTPGIERNKGQGGLTFCKNKHAWFTCPVHGLVVGNQLDEKGYFKKRTSNPRCLCPADNTCRPASIGQRNNAKGSGAEKLTRQGPMPTPVSCFDKPEPLPVLTPISSWLLQNCRFASKGFGGMVRMVSPEDKLVHSQKVIAWARELSGRKCKTLAEAIQILESMGKATFEQRELPTWGSRFEREDEIVEDFESRPDAI
jgi:hypothetical protein